MRQNSLPDKPFLTAEWIDIAHLTYRAPVEVIQPHVPPGCEPYIESGTAFVSWVGFSFLNLRTRGLKFPGCSDFLEVNLRTYVLVGDQLATVFIKEFVPVRIVVLAARASYNEPYYLAPMRGERSDIDDVKRVAFEWQVAGKWNRVMVESSEPAQIPPKGSEENRFKEVLLGAGVRKSGRTMVYRVDHPEWVSRVATKTEIDVDFSAVYGEKWASLSGAEPHVAQIADGSAVKLFHAEPLNSFLRRT